MALRYAFRGLGLAALVAGALYVALAFYFHSTFDVAYRVMADTGVFNPRRGVEFLVKQDYPWLIALRIANIAAWVAAVCAITYLEWRTRLGIRSSPLFCLPALFAYAAFGCLNDIVLNVDLTDLDLSASGTLDEGHIEIVLVLPFALLLSLPLFAMAFGAKWIPMFAKPNAVSWASVPAVVLSGALLWTVGSELVATSWNAGYTDLIQFGAYPGLPSLLFCTYLCLKIVLGYLHAPRGSKRLSN